MRQCSVFVFFLLAICSFNSFSQISEKEALQDKKAKIQKEIKLTNTLLQKAKKEKNQSVTTLNTLNKQIQSRQEIIQALDLEVKMASAQIANLKQQIQETQQSIVTQQELLDTLKSEYALMIRHAYFNRNAYDRLAFVFSSQSYNQAFKRLRYLQEYSQFRQKQVEEIKLAEQKLSDELLALKRQKVLLTVAKNEKIQSLESSQIELGILDSEQSSQKTLLSKLRKKEKQLKKELQSKERLAEELDKQIRKIIEEEIRLAKAKASKESDVLALTPEEQELADNFTSNKGKLPWPVERGVIIERFGVQAHPVLKGIETFNNGVKITTEEGALIRAVFEGTVSRIIDIPGAGKAVILSHGDYFSVYSNLLEVSVKRGQSVLLKEKIGTVLTKTNTKESITELQIWRGSEKMDPSSWLFQAY
ncbi:MAG: peptidoglycan DD-metalloendopeptidase family protein [Bacteroidota bacterium]|nr:peptidoglycan DD-metalloendopeptidase family protein [Bacteroidota bacterium]